MAVNLPNNPANGDSVLLNGTTYVYNSTNNSWDIPVVTEAILPLTSLSVGPEATPSGDGAISYDNTTGVFTYTPPVISGGSGTTAYANTTDLPTSEVTTGAMAYVSANNKLYIWNGTAWFNIAIVNQAPTAITGNQASYVLATDGTPTVVTLVSTDPEGLPLTWSSSTSGDTQVGTLSQTDNVFTITPSTDEANIGTLSVTFSVTDGNNTETSVSSFTLEFVSAYWNETVLSIGTSSTNGLANSTFIDRSTNAHTVTPAGTPVQTAFHPYLDNWGVEFDETGDYITEEASPSYGYGTSDFTIEFWMYLVGSSTRTVFSNLSSASGTQPHIYTTGTDLKFFTAGSDRIASGSLNANQWYHVSLCRGSSSTRLFIDGAQAGSTYADTNNYGSSAPLGIGTYHNPTPVNASTMSGYISNLRVIKGTALYTTNFTPPTENLTAVAGTSLLTCQSNRFIDNSTNAHTITVTGNPEISAFNPFGQASEYAVGNNKGTVEFSGDEYLSVPIDSSLQFGTGDFTIEFWLYFISRDTYGSGLINNYSSYTSGSLGIFAGHYGSSSTRYQVYYNGLGVPNIVSTSNIIYNAWQHIALVRNSGTITLYINGVSEGTSSGATASLNGVGSNWGIGAALDNVTNFSTIGSMADLRIVKGTAVYTTNFTPPTAPVGNTNASLYLPMDNAGIFDKTGNNTLTVTGSTATSTTQAKFATTSMYTAGNVTTDNSVAHFRTNDFTIEGWFYLNSNSVGYQPLFANYGTADSQGFAVIIETTNRFAFYMSNGSSWTYINHTATTPVANQWFHLSWVRNGSSITLYIDGSSIGSANISTNSTHDLTTGKFSVGYYPYFPGGARSLNGYIENFQILKGVAKYTANFTVPNRTQGREYQEES